MSAAEIPRPLFLQALANPKDGKILNELLGFFNRGADVVRIREFLGSADDDLIHAGVWLASEIGTKSKPLLPCIEPLFENQNPWVRSLCIDCTQICADIEHDMIARAILCVTDVHIGVRIRAMRYFVTAKREQLSSALLSKNHAGQNWEVISKFIYQLIDGPISIRIEPERSSDMSVLHNKLNVILLMRKMLEKDVRIAGEDYVDLERFLGRLVVREL